MRRRLHLLSQHWPKANGDDLAILSLYQETCAEIAKLRDYQWQIAYYFLSMAAGIIALLLNEAIREFLDTWLRIAITTFMAISVWAFLYYMDMYHGYLLTQRIIRQRIERHLRFHADGAYAAEALLPKEWGRDSPTKWFQFNTIVFPLSAAVVVAHVAGIVLLWSLDGPPAGELNADWFLNLQDEQ